MISITSKKEGFRRCGISHPKAVTEYPDDHFTKKELNTLKAEPMLTVTADESKAVPASKKTSGKKGNK